MAKRDAQEINASAFEDAGGSPSVLVFTWARPSFDMRYSRRKRITDYFRSLGASSVSFAEFSDASKSVVDKSRKSDLIYLTGGQVSTLLCRIKKAGIDRLLIDYQGVVVGRSAGALILGKQCLVTQRYSGTPKVVEGLGIVDFSVKVHYEPSKDCLLKDLSRTEKVYAIPQRSAVIANNGVLSFFGKVFLFENGEKTAVS